MSGTPLAELAATFYGSGGPGITGRDGKPVPKRSGVGLIFNCPCGCGKRRAVAFANPIDGGPPVTSEGEPAWQRTGESVEGLTLTPSLLSKDGCGWHGWIRDGKAVAA